MDAHERAAAFIAAARWDTLPPAVQRKARMCLVDSLGAALAGSRARVSRIGAAYAAEIWPGHEASVLMHGLRTSAVGAAFANACAANGIDIDDSARYAYGHAGAQLFPTVLALAEARGLSGAQLLCGLVVGYEVAHRVGRCWHASRRVYQACGSWGSVACAAAAAHLMDLPAGQAQQALGIAEFYAPNLPMMRDVDHPGMVKHGAEWAAMAGIVSAGLASRGFTGIPGLLSFPEYQDWGLDIGHEFLVVDGVAWKPAHYACCGWAHAGVEGALRLVREHHIPLDRITHILVEGCHGSMRLGTRLPDTAEQAQFNQAWPLAAMLVDGEIGPEQMLEHRLSDPRIRELAEKVEVVESAEMERLCRLFESGDPAGRFASMVTLTLDDGRVVHSGLVDGGLRFPPLGWDERRMSDKFRWLTGDLLQPVQMERILETLWSFEQMPDVRQLTPLLARPRRKQGQPVNAGWTKRPPRRNSEEDTRVVDFILDLDWDSLDPELQLRAKLCLLNILGAALAGMGTPAGKIAAQAASDLWRGGGATIFLQPQGVRAPGAAFANACAASALNLDDVFLGTRRHPGAQLVPAVLAVAEQSGASVREMLTALVAGGEIALRIARCWKADHETEQSSGSWGSVACAAAAARLLHLSREKTFHALGIADYHAPNAPLAHSMRHSPMDQHAAGWGAMNGVVSALLAQRGFTGIPSLLHLDQYYPWIWDIGQEIEFPRRLYTRSWAACDHAVTVCQAALSLVSEQHIPLDQIRKIQLRTFGQALLLPQGLPRTTEEAQNSPRWLVACLLLDGEIGPDQVQAPRLADPRLRSLFERMELVLDPQVEGYASLYDEEDCMPGAVTITLLDGCSYDSGIFDASAGLLETLSVENKFRRLAGRVLPPAAVEAVISLVQRCDQLDNAHVASTIELTALLGPGAAEGMTE